MTKGMGGGEGRASICGRMRRAPLPENPVKPVLALCCALLLVPSALAAETLKYVALVDGGKKAGDGVHDRLFVHHPRHRAVVLTLAGDRGALPNLFTWRAR